MALDKATYTTSVEAALNALWSVANLADLQAELVAAFTTMYAAGLASNPPATDQVIQDAAAASIAAPIHKFVLGGGTTWPLCQLAHTIAENTTFTGGTDLLIDNVPVLVGYRILVTGQVLSYNNGIYVVTDPGTGADGTWVRADDLDVIGEVSLNDIAFVAYGDTQSSTFWKVTAVPPVSLAAGILTFTQQPGPPAIATLASALADANDAVVKSGAVTVGGIGEWSPAPTCTAGGVTAATEVTGSVT